MTRRKLMFLATEDWFVRSHFLPIVHRAIGEGFEVVVWARDTGALSGLGGVRVIDSGAERGGFAPWTLATQVANLKHVLGSERPDIVHAIALKPIVLLSHTGHRSAARVLALTGRGVLAAGAAPWKRLLAAESRRILRSALSDDNAVVLVENRTDAEWAAEGHDRVMVMPGAGVDTDQYSLSPEPAEGMVVGLVSRLIRSKGVDVAVRAVQALRARGQDVSLIVAGDVDRQNPDHYKPGELAAWNATPGVSLVGKVRDIPSFWRSAHIACLPSRGGEGLPRSLLEAAACGRPIVTTATPGCADFVDRDVTGLIVPCGDPFALADAIQRLASDAGLRARMGAAGRAKVLADYTERHAADVASEAWRRASDRT